ncbi:response regulator transcription factor [Sphingomonas sp. GCM10030256]|uniref:response regulator transcription factor n=1 Tax=Sphingomonas sp. GCM10030256 TaxID=3273427 RepID=UPI00361B95AF
MSEQRIVYVIDDEEAVRKSTSFLLKTSGYAVKCFGTGDEFLALRNQEPGCVLLDLQMPGLGGLEVQDQMRKRGQAFPVIVLTGHGDIHAAVHAMRAGALNFLEKPYDREILLQAVAESFARLDRADRAQHDAEEARIRLNALTPREHDVLCGLVNGYPNKTIAYDLQISPRTVEVHRANLMSKLEVATLSDVLRIAFTAGLGNGDG